MQKSILFCLVIFFCSCNNQTANADKLIRDYYKKQETMVGGGRTQLKDLKIISTTNRGDTTLATAIVNGIYIPNQVPGSGPASNTNDTLYWKFYKKDGEWRSTYNYTPR